MTRPQQPDTLIFRHSRRSLWLLVPAEVALSLLVGLALLRDSPVLMTIVVVGLAGLNVGMTLVARVYARTAIEPDGLRVRGFGQRLFPWPEIREVDVMPTVMGKVIRIAMNNGFVFALSAPRHGIIRADPRFDEAVTAIRTRIAAARTGDADAEQAGGL